MQVLTRAQQTSAQVDQNRSTKHQQTDCNANDQRPGHQPQHDVNRTEIRCNTDNHQQDCSSQVNPIALAVSDKQGLFHGK